MLTHGLVKANITADQRCRFTLKLVTNIAVWLSLVLGLSYANMFVPSVDQTFPILGVANLGPAILGNVLLAGSETASQILKSFPIHLFATIQIYRIIGVVFLLMQSDGLFSAFFATSTGWGDIFFGVTAPVVGYLLWKNAYRYRLVGFAWCVAGISDLLFLFLLCRYPWSCTCR